MNTKAAINPDEVAPIPDLTIKVIGIGNIGDRILQYVRNQGLYDASFSSITSAPDAAQAQVLIGNANLIFIVLSASDTASINTATLTAQIARSLINQTIAVVALPGSDSISVAASPLELTDYADATISIELDEAGTASNAFDLTCDRIYRAIYGIATTGTAYGELPDASGASMLMPALGIVRMASAKAAGKDQIKAAIEQSSSKLSLHTMCMKPGDDVLINITSPGPLKLQEISAVLAQLPSSTSKPMVMSSAADRSDEIALIFYVTRPLAGMEINRKDGRKNKYIYSYGGGVPFVSFENEGITSCLHEAVWTILLESGAHLESVTYGKHLLSLFGVTKRERKLLCRLTSSEVLALIFHLPEDAELLPAFFIEIRTLLQKLCPYRRNIKKAIGPSITLHMACIVHLAAHLRYAQSAGGKNIAKDDLVNIFTLVSSGARFRIQHQSLNATIPPGAETLPISLVQELLEEYLDEYIVRSKDLDLAWSIERGHIDDYRDTAMGTFGQSLALATQRVS